MKGFTKKVSIIIFTSILLINSMVAPIRASSSIDASSALFVIERRGSN